MPLPGALGEAADRLWAPVLEVGGSCPGGHPRIGGLGSREAGEAISRHPPLLILKEANEGLRLAGVTLGHG